MGQLRPQRVIKQGATEDARTAVQEALHYAPSHATAKANLAALDRMGVGGYSAAASAAAERRGPSPSTEEGWTTKPLSSAPHGGQRDSAAALGLAVEDF